MRRTVITAAVIVAATAVGIAVAGPAGQSAAGPPGRADRLGLAAPPPFAIEVAEVRPAPVPVETVTADDPAPAPPLATPSGPTPARDGDSPAGCDGEEWAIPTALVWRESRCDFGAINPGGCGGQGCLGAYQFDSRHFTGWANGEAACGDLDWTIPADQHECARRLSRDGTNLAPWGG